jgi:LacI family transcriptional regulator
MNIDDIAKLAGVSKSTVSRVISKNGYVASESQRRILQVMEEVNFSPNVFAKGMRTNRSHSIGILYPDLSNPFFAEWYAVVDRISRSSGYLNYICITDPKGETEEQRIDDLLARSIDGILLFPYRKDQSFLNKLRKITQHTPVVCCDSMFEGEGLSCVFANGQKGTFDAVQHLARTGKKRIAYIKGKPEFEVVNRRFKGYCEGLTNAGLTFDQQLVYEGKFKMDCGTKAAELFMELPNPPDAIMAATDYMALGVLDYLKKQNILIPEQIAVFGFDDLNFAANSQPTLSTIALPIQEMAESAISTLISLMAENREEPFEHIFNCELKIRQSTNK